MNKLPLLMTASVSTRGMKNACFTDKEREGMYVGALQFYIDKLLNNVNEGGYNIVFSENSGYDLTRIRDKIKILDPNRIEFISLNPEQFDISKGKGYNELLLINNSLKQSDFIQKSGAFLKVTGRYPIYNINYFVDYGSNLIFQQNKDLYIDIKDHKIYDWLRLSWNGHSADVRTFASTVDFYQKNIGNRYAELNDFEGRLAESLFFDVVKSNIGNPNIVCRFKREPHCGGIEGSNINAISFSKNQDSVKGKIKRYTGNFIRKALPFFWF